MTRSEYNPYLPRNYNPTPATTLAWRDPHSSERQRREFERFYRDAVLLSCPLLWPFLFWGYR